MPADRSTTVYEGKDDDLSVSAYRDHTPGFERDFVIRSLAFYNSETYLRGNDGDGARTDGGIAVADNSFLLAAA